MFSGGNSLPSTSNPISEVVNPAHTATVLGSSALGSSPFGQTITFTATVSNPDTGLVPVGSVEYFDGSQLLATMKLTSLGVASFTTKALSRGTHKITAVFLGTANFLKSTSRTISQTIV
jgi:hypothetical protein